MFLFICSECDDFSATAINSIPQEQWAELIPEDQLTEVEAKHKAAKKQDKAPFQFL